MTRAALITIITSALSLSGCGQSGTDTAVESGAQAPILTAATLGEQSALSTQDYLLQDKYASANTKRGETLSMQCRACHTLEQGGAAILGPNLHDLFGRTAGSVPHYSYSSVLSASGFVWTPRALDAWLAAPFAFMPGNRMSFPGLPDANDRIAVIGYLLRVTDAGVGVGL